MSLIDATAFRGLLPGYQPDRRQVSCNVTELRGVLKSDHGQWFAIYQALRTLLSADPTANHLPASDGHVAENGNKGGKVTERFQPLPRLECRMPVSTHGLWGGAPSREVVREKGYCL